MDKHLVRDSTTNALLNNDQNALISRKAQKQRENRIKEIQQQINELFVEIAEIKQLIKQITDR